MLADSLGDVTVFLALPDTTATSFADRCGFSSGRYFPAETLPASYGSGGTACTSGNFFTPADGAGTPSDFYADVFAQGSIAAADLPTAVVGSDFGVQTSLSLGVSLLVTSQSAMAGSSTTPDTVGGVACALEPSAGLTTVVSVGYLIVDCSTLVDTVSELATAAERCRFVVSTVSDELTAGSSVARLVVFVPVALYPLRRRPTPATRWTLRRKLRTLDR